MFTMSPSRVNVALSEAEAFEIKSGKWGQTTFRRHSKTCSVPVSFAASNTAPALTWTVGNVAVNAQDHLVAATSGGPRNLFIDAPAAVSDSTRAVDTFHRTPSMVQAVASTVDVKVPEGATGSGMASRGNDMKESIDTRPVTRVTGLPDTKAPSNPHKYLIETNPALTDIKSFMSSDYLLDKLGFDPDQSAKRLGDGLYEQRLIQQAVTARTGQAFLDGQTSNEGMFKYLMNNAIASKDALNLSVGVGLTSQQVAALTHDIVWLEEHEVNGEKVLVPVVYLAQANGRLGPTGALIAGNDVTLIAGENLDNVGTLKATNNLSATAGKDLVNSGSIEAGNRLDLLATNNIANKAGGIIAGKDVSLTTRTGDVINERTITSMDDQYGSVTQHKDYADNAARIEAVNDLTVKAAKDINVIGGVLKSGQDMTLNAGRDVNVASVQVNDSVSLGSRASASDVTQLGADIDAGRDFKADAKRDINIIASEIDAKRDVSMKATENLVITSAADEEHSNSKNKNEKRQEDHVTQVMSGITAGGDVRLDAGKDLSVISSRVTAGDEAYLVAVDNLQILALQDTDYSLYDMKKKGGFDKLKMQHDEVTDNKYVGSEIKAGGDLTLKSGGDQLYQVAQLESGNNITLDSGGAITFEAVKDLHNESHTKTDNNAAWVSSKGKGNTDETLRQTQMIAKGNIVIKAVDGLKIDIKDVNQQSVSQTIDAMIKADPQLAWLKEAEARGDVDWRLVKEIHESFKYENSGVGPAAQIAIAIMMSFVMGPGGLALVSGGFGGVIATSLATTAVTSTISNKGNLGAAFKETFSADSLKNAAIAGFTAGMLDYADAHWFAAGNSKTASILSSNNFTDVAIRTTGRAVISSGISTTIGGGSFADNFGSALIGEAGNVAMATGFNWVGDNTIRFPDGSVEKVIAHALMGGLISQVIGGDFATGAAAAGLNEAAINALIDFAGGNDQLQVMLSQLTGVLAATLVDGNSQIGASIAGSATTYNYLYHREVKEMLAEMDSKATDKEKLAVRDKYEALDKIREMERDGVCEKTPDTCRQIAHQLADDDTKFSELVKKLRVEGRGGEAAWVGTVQAGNLSSTTGMAGVVNSEGGGFFEKLANELVLMGAGILPLRSTGKGTSPVKSPDEKGTIPENMSALGSGRGGAFNEAKRQAGIPTSQQPSRVIQSVDKRGNPQTGAVYEFEVPTAGGGTRTVRIRDDAAGHDYGDGYPQNRGPHFNDEAGNHYDY